MVLFLFAGTVIVSRHYALLVNQGRFSTPPPFRNPFRAFTLSPTIGTTRLVSLREVTKAMFKGTPCDRVHLARSNTDGALPIGDHADYLLLETPNRYAEQGEAAAAEAVRNNSTATSQAQQDPLVSSATSHVVEAAAGGTTARVSANLEGARADALARTNAHLRGLRDGLVTAATTTPEETDKVCFVNDDNSVTIDGGTGVGKRTMDGSAEHHRRRDRDRGRGNMRGNSGLFMGEQQQQQQQQEGPEEQPLGHAPPTGVSRVLRSLVDALQERDVRIQVLEVDMRRAGDAERDVVSTEEASSLRVEVRRGEARRGGK